MAPVGHTSLQRVHSGRQKPRSNDISGCIIVSSLSEGRSTLLGHSLTQSWQAVQRLLKLSRLSEPAGFSATLRCGICFCSTTASPPSTRFSCALTAVAAATKAVVAKNLRFEPSTSSALAGAATTVGLRRKRVLVYWSASNLHSVRQSIQATQRE